MPKSANGLRIMHPIGPDGRRIKKNWQHWIGACNMLDKLHTQTQVGPEFRVASAACADTFLMMARLPKCLPLYHVGVLSAC